MRAMAPLHGLASLCVVMLLGCGGGIRASQMPNAPQFPVGTPDAGGATNALPDAPLSIATAPSASCWLGGIVRGQGVQEAGVALYQVTLDPIALTAKATLMATRQAQATDDQYELDIAAYFGRDDLRIIGISGSVSTLDLTWRLQHPFAAPTNLSNPATASNRADLGIAGRVLYLVDTPSVIGSTYFTGTDDVVVQTALVTNADAYYKPNDLIDTSTLLANTFPYHALVNEALDPRDGSSNAGVDTGNYSAPTGWQGTNIGATRDQWTGYGMLMQGQAVTQTVSLDRTTLASFGFTFDVAVLAKYTDPRGGVSGVEKRANRLPANPADITRFVYRAPHCALDVERVEFEGEGGGLLVNSISASELRFHVVDWDARATETAAADLGADTNIQTVPVGAGGVPSLSVCIPGVLGDASVTATFSPSALTADDSAYGGDVGIDSGTPRDPLFYRELVTKNAQSGQLPGDYTGLVRVEDPEFSLARGSWYFPLNGTVVPPLPLSGTDELPEPVSYQAFKVSMTPLNASPTATVVGPGGQVASGNGVLTLTVAPYNDPDGDPLQIRFDWNNDGDYNDLGESYQALDGTPPDTFNSPLFYNNTTASAVNRSVPWTLSDSLSSPVTGAASFTLGPNQAPGITGGALSLQSSVVTYGNNFSLVDSGISVSDPEGDTITFTITAIPTTGGTQSVSGLALGTLNGYNASPVMGNWGPGNAPINFRIYANDATHTDSSGTLVPSSPLPGTVSFLATWGNNATNLVSRDLVVDATGQCYIVGYFSGTADFDPSTTGTFNVTSGGGIDAYCLALDANGALLWVRTWGGPMDDNAFRLEQASGLLRIVGAFQGTADFDPGAGTASRASVGGLDAYLLSLNIPSGSFNTIATWGGLSDDSAVSIAVGSTSLFVTGYFNGTADFDPGAGTASLTTPNAYSDGYCLSLTGGMAYQWASKIGGSATTAETAFDVAAVAGSAPAIVGVFGGTVDFDPSAGTVNRTSIGGADAYYLRLTSGGAYGWVGTWGGTSNDYAYGLALDTWSAARIVGAYSSTVDFDPGAGVVNRTSNGGLDAYCVSISNGNAYQWVATWGGTLPDSAEEVCVTGEPFTRIGGSFYSTVDFNPGAGVANRLSVGAQDAYCLALDNTGAYQWAASWGGTASESVTGIGLAPAYGIRLLGDFASLVDFDPGPGVTTRASVGPGLNSYLLGLTPAGTF